MDPELRMLGLLVMWLGGVLTGYAIGRVTSSKSSPLSRVPAAPHPPRRELLVQVAVSRPRRVTRQHQALRPMPEVFRPDAAVGGSE